MYFETTLKGKKWHVEVHEHKLHWLVTLKEDGSEQEVHKISKTDYRRMDDAISFLFENSSYMLDVVGEGLDYSIYTRGSYRSIRLLNDEGLLHESLKGASALGGSNQLTAGMPGKIVDIFVKPGDTVKAKQSLLIMEAMKMENEMRASHDAVIKEVLVRTGQSVEAGAQLITFES